MVTRCAKGLILLMLWTPSAWPADSPPDDDEDNSCRGELPTDAEALDAMRAGLQRGVCSTARFVDRLFGAEHEYSEFEDDSNGRVGATLGWNEQDGANLDGRFRVSVTLPALNERLNATIGRASSDEFVADQASGIGPLGGSFSDDDPPEWFAGIGYRVHRARDSRFDLGAGVQLESPLNPYVNARYRQYLYRSKSVLLTMRSTAFWESDEGLGVTEALDVDRVLGHDYLLRWGNSARMSEKTKGVRWRSRVALYQAIDYRRAMRYEVSVRGETDGTQPDRYGLRVTHRRSMWRNWLFVEMGGALFWADGPEPEDRCHGCLGASFGFEILFGQAYDRALRREAREQKAADKAQ
ncbi:MAG: hypothetical protein HW417_932 [Steroidobacteraceae bacterium]|nr:hypothetical protein [Steroidobacteraceae bacterium]